MIPRGLAASAACWGVLVEFSDAAVRSEGQSWRSCTRTPILWRSGGALDKVDKLVNCNIYIYGYRYRGFMGCLCFWIFLDAYGCLWMFMDVYGMVGIASNPQKVPKSVSRWFVYDTSPIFSPFPSYKPPFSSGIFQLATLFLTLEANSYI